MSKLEDRKANRKARIERKRAQAKAKKLLSKDRQVGNRLKRKRAGKVLNMQRSVHELVEVIAHQQDKITALENKVKVLGQKAT